MAYAVLTLDDLLAIAAEDATTDATSDARSDASRLAAALDAVEGRGYTLVTIDRHGDEAHYVFHGTSGARRLGNIR